METLYKKVTRGHCSGKSCPRRELAGISTTRKTLEYGSMGVLGMGYGVWEFFQLSDDESKLRIGETANNRSPPS
jgi:hypothetical protein